MPRDSGGNYQLPAGNPVEGGTLITDTWANPTMSDIGAEISDSLSRSGKGGMLAPFQNADGTKAAPGITWSQDPASGWYRAGTGDFRYAIAGTDVVRINNGSMFIWDGDGAKWDEVLVVGGAGAAVWGTIVGTLSDQADLQAALDAKANAAETLTAALGNTFAKGEVGMVNASGEVVKAQADSETNVYGELVLATDTINGGAAGVFLKRGVLTGLSALTAGAPHYVSATVAGQITEIRPGTTGNQVRVIGYGRSATELAFEPSGTWLEIS